MGTPRSDTLNGVTVGDFLVVGVSTPLLTATPPTSLSSSLGVTYSLVATVIDPNSLLEVQVWMGSLPSSGNETITLVGAVDTSFKIKVAESEYGGVLGRGKLATLSLDTGVPGSSFAMSLVRASAANIICCNVAYSPQIPGGGIPSGPGPGQGVLEAFGSNINETHMIIDNFGDTVGNQDVLSNGEIVAVTLELVPGRLVLPLTFSEASAVQLTKGALDVDLVFAGNRGPGPGFVRKRKGPAACREFRVG